METEDDVVGIWGDVAALAKPNLCTATFARPPIFYQIRAHYKGTRNVSINLFCDYLTRCLPNSVHHRTSLFFIDQRSHQNLIHPTFFV